MRVYLSFDSVKAPLTGIGIYTQQIATEFSKDKQIDLHVTRRGHISNLRFEHKKDALQAKTNLFTKVRQTNKFLIPIGQKIEDALVSKRSRNYKGIIHGPNYYVPNVPQPKITTIHDLSVFRDGLHPSSRVTYLQKVIRQSIKRSDLLIADCDFVRDEIIEYFKVSPERVYSIPLASRYKAPEGHPRFSKENFSNTLNWGEREGYSLYLGTIEPRKNLIRLIRAYRTIKKDLRYSFPLVLVGHLGWMSDDIMTEIQKGAAEGWLFYRGFEGNDVVRELLRNATIFLFPSLYEGFGLPVIEAMELGVPVICSDAASLPEVGGNAATYFSPFDTEQMSFLIKKGLEDSKWRKERKLLGLSQVRRFSWAKTAQKTKFLYEMLR